MPSKNTQKSFIACKECKGEGLVSERVSAYDSEIRECKTCDGLGVLQMITETSITIQAIKKKDRSGK